MGKNKSRNGAKKKSPWADVMAASAQQTSMKQLINSNPNTPRMNGNSSPRKNAQGGKSSAQSSPRGEAQKLRISTPPSKKRKPNTPSPMSPSTAKVVDHIQEQSKQIITELETYKQRVLDEIKETQQQVKQDLTAQVKGGQTGESTASILHSYLDTLRIGQSRILQMVGVGVTATPKTVDTC
eukprot:GFYU01005011.1.p1 GENE.GFYU01005011.1~~GFYU01005011.1.p1  ORF type:complete len:182 (+),score=39.64 GFYU01005011.1:127-672(+)